LKPRGSIHNVTYFPDPQINGLDLKIWHIFQRFNEKSSNVLHLSKYPSTIRNWTRITLWSWWTVVSVWILSKLFIYLFIYLLFAINHQC